MAKNEVLRFKNKPNKLVFYVFFARSPPTFGGTASDGAAAQEAAAAGGLSGAAAAAVGNTSLERLPTPRPWEGDKDCSTKT